MFVLLLGALMLFDGIAGKGWSFWSLAWPTAMAVIGLFGMLRRFSFVKLGLFVFGTAFLLENTDTLHIPYGGKLVLPVCLLILGISLLVDFLRRDRRSGHNPIFHGKDGKFVSDYDEKDGSFSVSCSFGSLSRRVSIPVLRGGSAECSFGELTVDLSGCEAAAQGCSVNLDCSFGELRLLVPRWMQAAVHEDQAFGGVKITGSPDPGAASMLQVSANASFGEIVIEYI